MDVISGLTPSDRDRSSWSDLAATRRKLFEARSGLAAAFLRRSGTGEISEMVVPVRAGVPPFVFALEKPMRPRSWWKRRAFRATQRRRRRTLEETGLFDAAWYRARYPDVSTAGMDALTHFLDHGSFEGRSPGPRFDAMHYLARYPDVVAERIEPWLHYVRHGKAEGRSAS